MKIKVNWLIPSDEGTFEIDLDDLDLDAEEWERCNEDERIEYLQNFMDERRFFSYGEVISFEEVNG